MTPTPIQHTFPWDWRSSHSQTGDRYHLMHATEPHRALCGVRPLCADDAVQLVDVPLTLRCRRHGCREKWPGHTAEPAHQAAQVLAEESIATDAAPLIW